MSNKNVSDEEALRALLSEVEARDQGRKEEINRNRRKRGGDRNHDRGRGNNRWGDASNNSNNHGGNKRSRYDDQTVRQRDDRNANSENSNYYGPASEQRGRDSDRDRHNHPEENSSNNDDKDSEKTKPKHKPNFGLS